MARQWIRYAFMNADDVITVFAKINCNDGASHLTKLSVVIFST